MYKIIKKNQKKFMAIFAAGLMVAFTLPTFFGQGPSNRGDVAFGSIGNEDFPNRLVQEARIGWEYLRGNQVSVDRFDRRSGEMRPELLLIAELGEPAFVQISANTEMYALLLEEARRMGVVVTPDMVKARLTGVHLPLDPDGNPEPAGMAALKDLFTVTTAFERIAMAAHISTPLRDHRLARLQSVAVSLVEFKAVDYLGKVSSEVDAKDLQAQFDQYKDTEAGVSTGNHSGFGYKVPSKARVQYIQLQDDKVRAAVEAELTPVDVRMFYKMHPDKYPQISTTTKTLKDLHLDGGAPAPTTQSARAKFFDHAPPAGVAAPRGFDDYRQEVRKSVLDDRAKDLSSRILAEITATMSADYVAFSKATPGSEPASSVGPSYGGKEYLDKLVLRIQEKYKVLPAVQTQGELKDKKQLAALPEIGHAAFQMDRDVLMAIARSGDFNRINDVSQRLTFGNYIVSFLDPLASEDDKAFARDYRIPTMALFQPSQPLESDGSHFIFRAVEAVAAHAPKSMDEVKNQVVDDRRLVKAYELAMADAKPFLEKARTQRLVPAANAANRPVVYTGLFGHDQGLPVDYPLPDQIATSDFVNGVTETLGLPSPKDPNHPVGLIELKENDVNRVVVAEIAAVKPSWKNDMLASYQIELQSELTQQTREAMKAQWYRFDDLEKRLNYHPTTARKQSQPTPTAPPAPPLNPITGVILPR